MVCAIAVILVAFGSAARSAEWSNDYAASLEAARRGQRPLLVLLTTPEVRITQTSATADTVDSALLEPFELCRIDVTTPMGAKLAEAFRAPEFPYVAITDKAVRRIIYRKSGQFTDVDWAATLVSYADGAAPVVTSTSSTTTRSRGICFS
jgi:hypothetical protein